jgi:hypothetical protein
MPRVALSGGPVFLDEGVQNVGEFELEIIGGL